MMKDSEIADLARWLLSERFANSGFQAAEVMSDTNFDGSPLIRVKARYSGGPLRDIRAIIDAEAAIQVEVRRQGDDRLVFLDNEYPDLAEQDEDDEEGEDPGVPSDKPERH